MSDASRGKAAYDTARKRHVAGDLDGAHAAYLTAVKHHPNPAAAYHDFGVLLRSKGHPRAAVACYRRALSAEPEDGDTWFNLGNALREIGDHEGALTAYSEALRFSPDSSEIRINTGFAQYALRDYSDAVASFQAALVLDPEDAEARLNLGLAQLHLGAVREGFEAYEARVDALFSSDGAGGAPVAPIWDGSPLAGRHLVVQAEQGLGDVLQFARFLGPLASQAGGPVSCEVPGPLFRLFQHSFPTVSCFRRQSDAPPHDLMIPLASLPNRLGVGVADLVPQMPYLATDVATPTLPETGRLKVGLTWSGNRSTLDRSCPFEDFMGVLGVDGVDFYSFQRGAPADDIQAHGAEALVTDLRPHVEDFADDAAYVRQLDLVISIDTSFCHLAGAMSVPTWVLLTQWADWRFPTDGSQTPWYPSFRLFRQAQGGRWHDVVSDARTELRHFVDQHAQIAK